MGAVVEVGIRIVKGKDAFDIGDNGTGYEREKFRNDWCRVERCGVIGNCEAMQLAVNEFIQRPSRQS
jgi:hypothetical protein